MNVLRFLQNNKDKQLNFRTDKNKTKNYTQKIEEAMANKHKEKSQYHYAAGKLKLKPLYSDQNS